MNKLVSDVSSFLATVKLCLKSTTRVYLNIYITCCQTLKSFVKLAKRLGKYTKQYFNIELFPGSIFQNPQRLMLISFKKTKKKNARGEFFFSIRNF